MKFNVDIDISKTMLELDYMDLLIEDPDFFRKMLKAYDDWSKMNIKEDDESDDLYCELQEVMEEFGEKLSKYMKDFN